MFLPTILILAISTVAICADAPASPQPLIDSTLVLDKRGDFLVARDITVLSVIAKPPRPIDAGTTLSFADYLTVCGSEDPGITLTAGLMDCSVIGLSTKRLVVARIETVYIRASAVTVVDGRHGSLYAFPPMAAPGTDGQGAGVLPMPEASGVSIAAGTARIFSGIRTGRLTDPASSKSITPADLDELTRLIRVPTPDGVLSLIPR